VTSVIVKVADHAWSWYAFRQNGDLAAAYIGAPTFDNVCEHVKNQDLPIAIEWVNGHKWSWDRR